MYVKVLVNVVLVVLIGVASECLQRNVVSVVNPECPGAYNCNSSVVHLFYVRADGENDTLHYFWSFHGKPTMTLALSSVDTKVSFSWPTFQNQSFIGNGSIKFSKTPNYVFGVVMNSIFEYNDVSDVGIFNTTNTNSSYVRNVPMPTNWTLLKVTSSKDSVKLNMLGSWNSTAEGITGGQFELNLEAYGTQSHGENLPHMLHSGNSSQMEMILRGLTTSSGFTCKRLGVELLVTASEHIDPSHFQDWNENSYKGLDDENTPGIFTLTELQSPASVSQNAGGFLQWRPVSYIADKRDITNSTEMHMYPVQNVSSSSEALNNTLLTVFTELDLSPYLTQSCIVSFGSSGDGFYSKFNYTSWTVTMGYGTPPFERFSLLVILVIGACLGVPGLLILGSSVYLCVRSVAKRKDDLLLTS